MTTVLAAMFYVITVYSPTQHTLYTFPFTDPWLCNMSLQALQVQAMRSDPGASISDCIELPIRESDWTFGPVPPAARLFPLAVPPTPPVTQPR